MTKDKRLKVRRKMPRLRKKKQDGEYDFDKDEVASWIKEQPELINFIADWLSYAGYIVYDAADGTWKGCDV